VQSWIITGYPECSNAAQRTDEIQVLWQDLPGGVEVLGRYALYNLSGPQHMSLHSFFLRYFEQGCRGAIRTRLQTLTDELFAELAPRGRCDVEPELAEILPGRAIMAVLGLPPSDEVRHALIEVNQAVKHWFETYGGQAEADAAAAARSRFAELYLPVVRARRDNPRDDLLSALRRAGAARVPDWDEEDMIGHSLFLFGAGSETTANVILTMVVELARQPGVRERVDADRSLIPRFVEEVLRRWAPVHVRVRHAAVDVEVAGLQIPARQAAGRWPV
jgi:cytochrome P450